MVVELGVQVHTPVPFLGTSLKLPPGLLIGTASDVEVGAGEEVFPFPVESPVG